MRPKSLRNRRFGRRPWNMPVQRLGFCNLIPLLRWGGKREVEHAGAEAWFLQVQD